MKRLKRATAFLLCFCMVWNLSVPQAYAMSEGNYSQSLGSTRYSAATASDAEKVTGDSAGDVFDEVETSNETHEKGETDSGNASQPATPSDGVKETVTATMTNALKANWGSYGVSIVNNNDGYDIPIQLEKTYQLEIEITPEEETELQPVFTSYNPSVAAVDESGMITAISTGWTTINVSIEYGDTNYTGSASDSISVRVIDREPCVITLYANGGVFEDDTTVKERLVAPGSNLDFPSVTNKIKIFSGWYADSECTQLVTDKYYLYPEQSMELYAGWLNSYTITYDLGGYKGSANTEYTIGQGKNIGSNYPYLPSGPTNATNNKMFAGWLAPDGTIYSDNELYYYIPSGDETLTAQWVDYYTIVYDYNGYKDYGGKDSKTEYVLPGNKLNNRPSFPSGDPEKTNNKLFAGWLTPDGTIYSANEMYNYVPSGDEVIVAQWSDYYTITYDYNGVKDNNGQESSYEYVLPGNKLNNRPSFPSGNPEATNNKLFVGWKNSEGKLITEYELWNYIPKRSETLTAQWSDYYVITFDYNGVKYNNKDSETKNVIHGDSVSAPYISDNPSQTEGKKFIGWQIPTGEILTSYQISSYKPMQDETIYAQWAEYYTITFDYNGVTYSSQTKQTKQVAKGMSLKNNYAYMPSNPEQTEGKMFIGWKSEAGTVYSSNEVQNYVPAGDETFTAQWTMDYYTVTFDYNGVKIDNKTEKNGYAIPGKAVTNYPYISSDTSNTEGKALIGWETEGKIISGNDLYRYIPTGNETLTAKWTEETIEITFDYNGVTYSGKDSSSVSVVPGKAIGYSVPSFSSDPSDTKGKLLKNWESNGKLYTSDEIVKLIPEGPMTFTAQWTSEYYTVTFDYNGVKYNGKLYEEKFVLPGEKLDTTPSVPTEPYEAFNKVLIGWQNGRGELFSNNDVSSYIPAGDETLTARWTSYITVTYDANGGTLNGDSSKEYVPAGEAVKKAYSPTRAGFEFAGWYEKETGKKAENNKYVPNSNVTLVAEWQEFYTITYDANGGTYNSDSYKFDKVIKGESVYLKGDYGYSRDGLMLEGWCEDQPCEGMVLTGNYVPDKDITLYAKWAPYYTVTFDPGIGTISNNDKKKVVKGKSIDYLEEPSCSEAAFEGWFLDKEFTQPVTRAYVPTADVTLYAKWSSDTYRVTFHAGGAWFYDSELGKYVSEVTKRAVKNQPLSEKYISTNRNNYECTWYLDPDYKTPFNWYAAIEADIDLYAAWSKRVTVYWDAEGGIDSSMKKNGSYYVAQGETRSLPRVEKEGYALTGWVTDSGEMVTDQTRFYEDTYIKAQWEAGYRVTLDLQGGKLYYNDYYKPVFYVRKGEKCGYKPAPTKAGVVFAGWLDENGSDIGKISSYIPSRDITLTANWISDYVTIRFHLENENDTIFDNSTGEDVQLYEVKLPRNMSYVDAKGSSFADPDKAGMKFMGWSLTEGGKEVIDLNSYRFTKDADLYPTWEECWYIGVEAMGGFISNSSDQHTRGYTVARGEALTVSALREKNMTKPGYIFDGWYDNAEFTGEKYTIPFTPTGNMTLYAKWTEGNVKKFTVSFDTAGGEAMEAVKIGEGSRLERPEDPVKEGAVFDGWYKDSDYLHLYYFTDPVYKDITLHAKWFETTDVNDASIIINGEYTYTGELIIPEVTVRLGNKTLVKDTDYTVGGGGTNAGYATVLITGINGYTGSREVSFKIEKAETNAKVPEGPFVFTFGQTFKEAALPEGWQWKNPDASVGNAGSRQAGIIYGAPDNNHKDLTALVDIMVEPLSLSGAVITLTDADKLEYDGNPKEPAIQSVMLNGVMIQAGGYEVSYTDNTEPGTAAVTITGKGNYKDTATVNFTIDKGDPELIVGKLTYEAVYGSTLASINLPEGWTWQTPDTLVGDVGTYSDKFKADFKAPANSKYKDKTGVYLKVKVNPRTIANNEVTMEAPPYILGDGPVEPEVTVVCGGVTLIVNQDYTLTYYENEKVGRAKAVVTGKGNYGGTVTKNFDIIDDPYDIRSAKITLSPDHATFTGSAIEPATSVVIAPVTLIRDTDYTVEYSNNVEPGQADVIVTGKGQYYGSQTVHFFITPEKYEIDATYGDKLGELKLPNGWEWKNPDTYVGDATETGRLFPAVFTAGGVTKEASFTVIVWPKSIEAKTVQVIIDRSNLVYNGGDELKPEVTIQDNALNEKLKTPDDYKVSYSNNTEAGQAGVRIEGVHNYTGIIEDQFTIDQAEPKPEVKSDKIEDEKILLTIKEEPFFLLVSQAGDGEITFTSSDDSIFTVEKKINEFEEPDGFIMVKGLGKATLTVEVPETKNYKGAKLVYIVEVVPVTLTDSDIKLEKTSYTYTGQQIKPAFTVVCNNTQLTEETDYTVSYGLNTKAGKDAGSVTVTGKGDYTGTAAAVFTIEKAENPSAVPDSAEAVYGQKLAEIALTGGWKWKNPQSYVGNAGDNSHEAVLAESENYLEKTGKVTVTVSPKALTESMITLEYTETEYDGTAKEPKVTAEDNGLITEQDYKTEYRDNTGLGDGVAMVTGQGNYTGTVEKKFTIVPAVLKEADVSLSETFVYDGTPKTPEPVVKVGDKLLVRGTDYEVAYKDNVDAGEGQAVVTGKGFYQGSVTASFTIEKAEPVVATPSELKAVYGSRLKEVELPENFSWTDGEAYVGSAGENTFAAMYTSPDKNYKDMEVTLTVTVEKRVLKAEDFLLEKLSYVYDGTAKTPAVKNVSEYLRAEDYSVSYEQNMNAGTAYAVVTGAGNTKGWVKLPYMIKKAVPVITVAAGTEITRNVSEGKFELGASVSNGKKLAYTSSDASVASVDENGAVTPVRSGTVVITITYEGDSNYEKAKAEVTVILKRSSSSGGSSSGGSSSGAGAAGSHGGPGNSAYNAVPQGYTGPTKVIGKVTVPEYVTEGTWSQAADGRWKFTDKSGKSYAGEWAPAYNPYADPAKGQSAFNWFLFDQNGNMITGWYTDENGNTFYLNPVSDNTMGSMATGWKMIDGKYYYFNEVSDGTRGKMLKDTTTPDGYYVNKDGVWDGNPKK